MKDLYCLLMLFCVVQGLLGQQIPQSSAYVFNPFQWNVAVAGAEQTMVATLGYRKQWSTLSGAPETQMLNVHLPVDRFRSGVGLRLQNDILGAHRMTGISFAYSYRLLQSKTVRLAIGLGAGFDQFRLDGTVLRAPEGSYDEATGLFTHNDDFLSESVVQTGGFSADVGVWLQTSRLQVGLGLQPAMSSGFRYRDAVDVKISRPMHLSLMATYGIRVHELFEVRPSVWVQTNAVKVQTNGQLHIGYKQNLIVGAGVRGIGTGVVESVTYLVGGRINPNSMLIYCFDSVTLPARSVSSSHELTLRYTLPKPIGTGKLPPIIFNPRYQ